MMTALLKSTRTERGSIPLSLLVVASLTMVMVALVSSTIGSSRAARFDEDYTEAIHAADAGLQEGVASLIRGTDPDVLADEPIAAGCSETNWNACSVFASGTSSTYGPTFTWEARKISALTFQVRSTGVDASGVSRTVVQNVTDTARFWVAAFSDQAFEMRGGNNANSYNDGVWYTGNGIVASNGTVTINGSSSGVDGVHLYNWDANPDLNRCSHSGGNDCNDVRTLPEAIAPSARIGEELVVGGDFLDTQFIDDQLASCPVNPPVDYTTSTYDSGSGWLGTAGTDTVFCFETFTVDADLDIYGNVEIYVYGDLLISNGTEVNCGSGCTPGSSLPDARTLTFYVDDSGDPNNPSTVAFGNHSALVGGVYAPESDCEGNPSNAQAELFGSLICKRINNQGGWSFHYDDRLGLAGAGIYLPGSWREEL